MAYTVYVIHSKEGHTYTGVTRDLDTRLKQHNEHTLSFWTKRGTGWKVMYHEEFESQSEAQKRERWLKNGVGREFLKNQLATT